MIVLDKVVQVNTETFENNAQMISEIEMIRHPYIVMLVFRILKNNNNGSVSGLNPSFLHYLPIS